VSITKRKRASLGTDSNLTGDECEMNVYAPWIIFYRQIEAMFSEDPEVVVTYDDETKTITLRVEDLKKAEALSKLLPSHRVFGNVEVTVTVVPANKEPIDKSKYLEAAFRGNGAFSHITTIQDIPPMHLPNPVTYCVFKKEVVQYDADDMSSESGRISTLYQDIAKELFGNIGGVYFCTDSE